MSDSIYSTDVIIPLFAYIYHNETRDALRFYFQMPSCAGEVFGTSREQFFLSKNRPRIYRNLIVNFSYVGSGQIWGNTPEQRIAASTLRRYSFGLRPAIAQADARPVMPISFR